jgi:hypothetical protein
VQPIIDATRIAQKWALFDGSSREQFRMHLEIQRAPNTSWEPLFIAGDERYQAYAEQIHFRRVARGVEPAAPQADRRLRQVRDLDHDQGAGRSPRRGSRPAW